MRFLDCGCVLEVAPGIVHLVPCFKHKEEAGQYLVEGGMPEGPAPPSSNPTAEAIALWLDSLETMFRGHASALTGSADALALLSPSPPAGSPQRSMSNADFVFALAHQIRTRQWPR